jgi:hypothetical protein
MVFQATQNAPTELEELSVERDVEADGYVVGFEDAGGSFVEVGRLENVADNVSQPLEINHQNSGERVTLDSSAFETSGDVSVGGSVQDPSEIGLSSLTDDPTSPGTGDVWYRSDIDELRLQTNIGVRTVAESTPPTETAPPATVTNQYKGRNFSTDQWKDSTGESDLLINGVSADLLGGSKSGAGDGTDDFAIASSTSLASPADLGEIEKFAIAFTINSTDTTNNSFWFGTTGSGGELSVIDRNASGEPQFQLVDGNSNALRVSANKNICDGDNNLVIIQKTSNDASDIDFYINDVTNPVQKTIDSNGNFSNQSYDPSNVPPMILYALNNGGSATNFKQVNYAHWEFNTDVYGIEERKALENRLPEL